MSHFLTVLQAVWCWGEMGGGGGYTNKQGCRHSIRLTAKGGGVASDMSPNQGRLVHLQNVNFFSLFPFLLLPHALILQHFFNLHKEFESPVLQCCSHGWTFLPDPSKLL
jgi:hypothetical protein